MRIDKLLEMNGYGSRKTIKRLFLAKKVKVNGVVIMQQNINVDPNIQSIQVLGKTIEASPHVYYLLNKPKGYVSSHCEKQEKSIFSILKKSDYKSDLSMVGRLDKDTEGVLLLTNNGKLAYEMLLPDKHVKKVYEVVVNGSLKKEDCATFKAGITFLDGTKCKPAKLEIIWTSEHCSKARVTLEEGKFHQVKKMFLCVGVKVTALRRVRFGPLTLDKKLAVGQYRVLNKQELNSLKAYFC